MILELTIKNFKSIENETIDFRAENKIKEFEENVRVIGKDSFLTSNIFYGRNAAGKSNFLEALDVITFLVTNSSNFKHNEIIYTYNPFKFDAKLENKPTEFDVLFITKGKKFKYNIIFNQEKILYESLYFYSSNKASKLFIRELNKPISYGELYSGNKKIIEKDLLSNQLFLSKSASYNIELLKEAFLFFDDNLFTFIIHDTNFDEIALEVFYKNLDNTDKEKISNILRAGDVNIFDFEIKKHEKEQINLPSNIPNDIKDFINNYNKMEIFTYHKTFNENNEIGIKKIKLEEESLGTKKLFLLSKLIINSLNLGSILIVDELDKSLHPLLTKLLIKIFHSKKNNPNNAQLIFASHDVSMLDNELFRRDQIYFVEKDYYGKSSTYRLSDIKDVRANVPYDKWYLSGRFSGIPIIEDLDLDFTNNEKSEKNK